MRPWYRYIYFQHLFNPYCKLSLEICRLSINDKIPTLIHVYSRLFSRWIRYAKPNNQINAFQLPKQISYCFSSNCCSSFMLIVLEQSSKPFTMYMYVVLYNTTYFNNLLILHSVDSLHFLCRYFWTSKNSKKLVYDFEWNDI